MRYEHDGGGAYSAANKSFWCSCQQRVPPKVIRNEAENEYYIDALYALEQKQSLSREEKEFSDLLTLLIEDFEERRYQMPRATPLQALGFLGGTTRSQAERPHGCLWYS